LNNRNLRIIESTPEALDEGSLTLYGECGGNIEPFFARFLSPKVTGERIQ